MPSNKKVILISGASSGIGLASLTRLAADGHTVYGGSRDDEGAQKIKNAGGLPVGLEVTSEKSLQAAVKKIINSHGAIDVLFNNAGYGLYGSVEDVPISEAKKQFEVNLFGLANLTQLVLPHMRANGSGQIINTSSMGGKMYTPLGAWYHATKHALEGWSDCLRLELKQFNINVAILEPGAIQTPWGYTAADNLTKYSGDSAYKKFANSVQKRTLHRYKKGNKSLTPPDAVGATVQKIIEAARPKTRYVVGKYARSAMFFRKYFGDRFFDWFVLRTLK